MIRLPFQSVERLLLTARARRKISAAMVNLKAAQLAIAEQVLHEVVCRMLVEVVALKICLAESNLSRSEFDAELTACVIDASLHR